jgi:hypothetical protein
VQRRAAANRKGGEASQWGGQDKKGKKENQDPVCYLCNLPGHVKDCPSKAGTAGARLKWWLQTRLAAGGRLVCYGSGGLGDGDDAPG